MSLKVTKDGTAKLFLGLSALASERVLVGIPASEAERQVDEEAGDRGPINNAAIGKIMEEGSPIANIPARPHLKPTVREKRDDIVKTYKAGAKAVLDGKARSATAVHHRVGLLVESAVKAKINEGDFIPLAPATIAKRKAKGRKSEKPLVDTAQYRNAITHVVREGG